MGDGVGEGEAEGAAEPDGAADPDGDAVGDGDGSGGHPVPPVASSTVMSTPVTDTVFDSCPAAHTSTLWLFPGCGLITDVPPSVVVPSTLSP